MKNVLHLLDAICHSDQRCILATIIHIEGTAYLKEGTMMSIKEDGTKVGMLSAGCLEEDLILRCRDIFNSPYPQTVRFDLSNEEDEQGWGQGTGCNGVLYILLEPVTEEIKREISRVKLYVQNGHSVLHIKEFTEEFSLKQQLYLYPEDQYNSEYFHFHNGVSGIQRHNSKQGSIYAHVFEPVPRMVIFGAGEDAIPLVSLASSAGFDIALCDWRPAWCTKDNFPAASRFFIGFPKEILNDLALTDKDFVIVMSHNFKKDQEFIQGILNKNIRYLGVLGPRRRTVRLLGKESIPLNVSSPIGILIGARGPFEIAVSIMAEVIQEFRQSKRELNSNEQR